MRYDENQGGHVPVPDADFQSNVPGLFVVGDGAGVAGSAVAIEEGRIARIVAGRRLGRLDRRWLVAGSSGSFSEGDDLDVDVLNGVESLATESLVHRTSGPAGEPR